MGAGGEEVQVVVFGGWTDVGVLGGGWTRESGGGRVRGGWIDELVYLVSVGGCVCVRVFSVGFGPGLDSKCLPQGIDTPPAMLRGRTAGLPKKTGRPGLRRGGVGGYNLQCSPRLWHTNHEQAVSVWCLTVVVISDIIGL